MRGEFTVAAIGLTLLLMLSAWTAYTAAHRCDLKGFVVFQGHRLPLYPEGCK